MADRLRVHGRRAVVDRARALAHFSRAPAVHVARHRARLHQQSRELRASARRRLGAAGVDTLTRLTVLTRKAAAARGPEAANRRAALAGLAAALAAHDPERTLERGYAIVDDGAGTVVTSANQARQLRGLRLFFADAAVRATIIDEETP
jgi:exodeoxyribonuclease VII large subunit